MHLKWMAGRRWSWSFKHNTDGMVDLGTSGAAKTATQPRWRYRLLLTFTMPFLLVVRGRPHPPTSIHSKPKWRRQLARGVHVALCSGLIAQDSVGLVWTPPATIALGPVSPGSAATAAEGVSERGTSAHQGVTRKRWVLKQHMLLLWYIGCCPSHHERSFPCVLCTQAECAMDETKGTCLGPPTTCNIGWVKFRSISGGQSWTERDQPSLYPCGTTRVYYRANIGHFRVFFLVHWAKRQPHRLLTGISVYWAKLGLQERDQHFDMSN